MIANRPKPAPLNGAERCRLLIISEPSEHVVNAHAHIKSLGMLPVHAVCPGHKQLSQEQYQDGHAQQQHQLAREG